jgi:fatty-acyl-CoA synthase
VTPGSGERGRIAVYGHIPVGYYKDEEKTRATFPTVGGVRYSIAGDWATIGADGSITLLGRGSVCINTGGEKVFPEEVEEILKKHRSVVDAVCVGVPDPRFGQSITAIVELAPESGDGPPEEELIALVKRHLAPYKAPRRVLSRAIARAANGKADYNGLREWATNELGRE